MTAKTVLTSAFFPVLALTLTLSTAPAFADDPAVDPAGGVDTGTITEPDPATTDGPPVDVTVDDGASIPVDQGPDVTTEYDPIIAQSGVPTEVPTNHGILREGSHFSGESAESFGKPDKFGHRPSLFGSNSPLLRWFEKHAAK